MNLVKKFRMLYTNKNYLVLILYMIVTLILALMAIALVSVIIEQLFSFIAKRLEILAITIIPSIMIYFGLRGRKQVQLQEQQNAIAQALAEQQSAERALCENNYSIVRQILFNILIDSSEILNLVKPTRLSELDSPSRTVLKGNVYMCQFVVVKKGEAIQEKVKEMLQLRINQKLNAQEFAGIVQTTYIYNGIAYPILYVDQVSNSGAYVQIDIAWVSENYCNLLSTRAHAKFQNMQPPNNNLHDKDF